MREDRDLNLSLTNSHGSRHILPEEGTAFPIVGGYDADATRDEVYEYECSGVFSNESESLG